MKTGLWTQTPMGRKQAEKFPYLHTPATCNGQRMMSKGCSQMMPEDNSTEQDWTLTKKLTCAQMGVKNAIYQQLLWVSSFFYLNQGACISYLMSSTLRCSDEQEWYSWTYILVIAQKIALDMVYIKDLKPQARACWVRRESFGKECVHFVHRRDINCGQRADYGMIYFSKWLQQYRWS